MVELILQQRIEGRLTQASKQLPRDIIPQVVSIGAPRERDDVHPVPPTAQMFYQQAVIQIPSGEGV
jgi:hypothetical protein